MGNLKMKSVFQYSSDFDHKLWRQFTLFVFDQTWEKLVQNSFLDSQK